MRVLFLNEGNLGSHVMGQGQLARALRTGLAEAPEVEARFAGLTPMGRLAQAAATRPLPLLSRLDLDLRPLRWYAVQSLRARRALRGELRGWPAQAQAQVVHVHSHSVALAMGSTMRSLPIALSLDTTMRDWLQMPAWQRTGLRYRATMAPGFARERRTLTRAALVLAWTAWARRSAQEAAPRANVVEHHPGIELDRYRPAASRHERALPRVLFVGGRFAEKGGEDLLHALGEELGRSVELDLVTPAPVQSRPGVRVHRLEPSDPRLLELQQQADVFLPAHPRRRGPVGGARGDGLRDPGHLDPHRRHPRHARRRPSGRAGGAWRSACPARGAAGAARRCNSTRAARRRGTGALRGAL